MVNDNLARIFAGPTLVVVATFLAVALVLRYVFLHPNVIAVISVAIAALGVLLVASANRGYLVPDTRRLRLRQQHVANDIARSGRSVVTQLIGPPLQAYRGTIFVAIRDLAESSLLSEEMGAIAYPSATLEVGVAIGDCDPWDEIQRSIDVPGEDSTIVEFTVSVTILGSPLNPRQVVLLAPPTGNSESAFFPAPHHMLLVIIRSSSRFGRRRQWFRLSGCHSRLPKLPGAVSGRRILPERGTNSETVRMRRWITLLVEG